jgi:hypothetical protein
LVSRIDDGWEETESVGELATGRVALSHRIFHDPTDFVRGDVGPFSGGPSGISMRSMDAIVVDVESLVREVPKVAFVISTRLRLGTEGSVRGARGIEVHQFARRARGVKFERHDEGVGRGTLGVGLVRSNDMGRGVVGQGFFVGFAFELSAFALTEWEVGVFFDFIDAVEWMIGVFRRI